MKIEEMRELLRGSRFLDYTFIVVQSVRSTPPYLQASYVEPDIVTGARETQNTRKWQLSLHMTRSEFVQTAFKCCLTSMEHRTREHFRYRGAAVYGPHFDVDALFSLCAARLAAKLGGVKCAELTTKHFADVLEGILAEGKLALAKVVRARSIAICKRGLSLGYMTTNPAQLTEGVKFRTKRSRLTLDTFLMILDEAPKVSTWLENAMLLALVSGQDRSTCARWQRSWIKRGHAHVTRQKTGVVVEIPTSPRLDAIGMTLADVIAQCKKTGVISQYLIHYKGTKNGTVPGAPSRPRRHFSGVRARSQAGWHPG